MKKRLLVIASLSLLLFTAVGCGREEVEETEKVETQTISIKIDDIPNIMEMSKEELLAMKPKEVKASVEAYLPNYRETYKIDENTEMTDEKWLLLRDIICTQLYGSSTIEAEANEEFSEDANAIYYAPTYESIEAMPLEEFRKYLNGMYAYYYGEEYLTQNGMDFASEAMPDEEIQKLKTELLEQIKNGTVSIGNVN